MPAAADPLLFQAGALSEFRCQFCRLSGVAVRRRLGRAAKSTSPCFFMLAVLGLEVFGVILAGYASGSKWSLFGGMREAAQVVSYEVPLGLCVIVPVMICGTMNLVDDRRHAGGLVHQLADLSRSVYVLSCSGSISPVRWPA